MSSSGSGEPNVQSLFDLTGKVALVTGAAGHLGGALARALAEAGAAVVVSSRDLARAREIASDLPSPRAAEHSAVAIDHMSEESCRQGFGEAARRAGRIDVLVNNGHEHLGDDWTTVSAESFTRQLGNASGYFILARLLRDHAVAQGAPASIILLGSMYGLVGSYPEVYDGIGAASSVAYQTLKGGILQMTRHLSVYWARDAVRVNCLSPGPFPEPTVSPALAERLAERTPVGRIGRPEELKGAVLFLASEASSYVTGHNLVVDGGWTAW